MGVAVVADAQPAIDGFSDYLGDAQKAKAETAKAKEEAKRSEEQLKLVKTESTKISKDLVEESADSVKDSLKDVKKALQLLSGRVQASEDKIANIHHTIQGNFFVTAQKLKLTAYNSTLKQVTAQVITSQKGIVHLRATDYVFLDSSQFISAYALKTALIQSEEQVLLQAGDAPLANAMVNLTNEETVTKVYIKTGQPDLGPSITLTGKESLKLAFGPTTSITLNEEGISLSASDTSTIKMTAQGIDMQGMNLKLSSDLQFKALASQVQQQAEAISELQASMTQEQ